MGGFMTALAPVVAVTFWAMMAGYQLSMSRKWKAEAERWREIAEREDAECEECPKLKGNYEYAKDLCATHEKTIREMVRFNNGRMGIKLEEPDHE